MRCSLSWRHIAFARSGLRLSPCPFFLVIFHVRSFSAGGPVMAVQVSKYHGAARLFFVFNIAYQNDRRLRKVGKCRNRWMFPRRFSPYNVVPTNIAQCCGCNPYRYSSVRAGPSRQAEIYCPPSRDTTSSGVSLVRGTCVRNVFIKHELMSIPFLPLPCYFCQPKKQNRKTVDP